MAYWICPKCEEENEAHVELPDEVDDLDDGCPECGYQLTRDEYLKFYSDLLIDAQSDAIDRAMDW
jgi:Zn ribbon nucleic-acid-binding protein